MSKVEQKSSDECSIQPPKLISTKMRGVSRWMTKKQQRQRFCVDNATHDNCNTTITLNGNPLQSCNLKCDESTLVQNTGDTSTEEIPKFLYVRSRKDLFFRAPDISYSCELESEEGSGYIKGLKHYPAFLKDDLESLLPRTKAFMSLTR